MSPCLFNLLMDATMKKVREKACEFGVTLKDERRNIEWKVDWLMFADDNVKKLMEKEAYYYYYYIPDGKLQLGGTKAKNPKAPTGKTAQ